MAKPTAGSVVNKVREPSEDFPEAKVRPCVTSFTAAVLFRISIEVLIIPSPSSLWLTSMPLHVYCKLRQLSRME